MPVELVAKPRVSLSLQDAHDAKKVHEQGHHTKNVAAHHCKQELIFSILKVQKECKCNNLDGIVDANDPYYPDYTILQFLLEGIEVLFLDEEHRAVSSALKLDHGGDCVPL